MRETDYLVEKPGSMAVEAERLDGMVTGMPWPGLPFPCSRDEYETTWAVLFQTLALAASLYRRRRRQNEQMMSRASGVTEHKSGGTLFQSGIKGTGQSGGNWPGTWRRAEMQRHGEDEDVY
ncbi:hypothetical protein E4U41_006177 [Claviceps citrina]|nr:hypothetical protein E4U41_006177 [Claviceps citrina]